ncbi:MAG: hypothetical protein R3192_09645 [Woeseiaceae bacterium]|nr:hypothetical protein [Woeseiaceae bacterium]
MRRPGFLDGVVVAAAFAFAASAAIAVLAPMLGFFAVLRLIVPALGLAYLLYLFSRNRERVGRVTTLILWSALAGVTWWLAPPLPLYLLIHVGAIWLVRSLYFYAGFLPALMDLGLSGLALAAAAWAFGESASVFLATWCFFLVQALFTTIPRSLQRKAGASRDTGNESFERARRQADRALAQLFNQ